MRIVERGFAPLTEPVPVVDVFATGVDWQVETDFVRIIYWAEHPLEFGGDGQIAAVQRVIVAKIVMPLRVWLALPFRRPEPANVG